MRKLGIVILALGILLLVATPGFAATRVVPDTYATINAAITAANNGDLISVKPGTYNENVVINKNVRVVSTGGRLVTKITAVSDTSIIVDFVGVSDAAVNGFTISGARDGWGVNIGFLGGSNVRVKNCIIEHNGVGVYVASDTLFYTASNVTIDNNLIRNNTFYGGGTGQGSGIFVEGSSANVPNVVITNNEIVNNDGYGIYVFGSSGSPSFSGMRLGSNTVVNNFAVDITGVLNNHNWEWGAILFSNASGSIILNNNKIRTPAVFPAFWVLGGAATFSGTGNQQYNNFRVNVGGTATPLATP